MRKKEQHIEIMKDQMPFYLSPNVEPYIQELMGYYADEFACAFAEWKEVEKIELSFRTAQKGCIYVYKDMTYTTTELLEIFKKEINGL